MRSVPLALFLFTVAVACAPTPSTPAPAPSCAAADIAFASAAGSATIEGQAFLKTQGGQVKVAAGNEVELVPVCAGSTQWMAKQVKWLAALPMDSSLQRATRTTTADGDGRFRFTSIPAGDYYAVSQVWWSIPGRYQKEGGFIAQQVHAADGQTASVVVTAK